MIGDGRNDMEAGQNAGCRVCALGEVGMDGVKECVDLYDCVTRILSPEKSAKQCH